MVLEEMFLNEHVACSVAELFAEQDAWGAEISQLQVRVPHVASLISAARDARRVWCSYSLRRPCAAQVFDSLGDMVHAAVMAQPEHIATLGEIARFCSCCRWLKEVKGLARINSYATFQSETAFKAMLVQATLANKDEFQRVTEANQTATRGKPGTSYRRAAAVADTLPKTSVVNFSRGLLRTQLWSDLTQRALNDRATRMAACIVQGDLGGVHPTGGVNPGNSSSSSAPRQVSKKESELLLTGASSEQGSSSEGDLPDRAKKLVELILSRDDASLFKNAVDKELFPECVAIPTAHRTCPCWTTCTACVRAV
jgi:hypothetical protein